MAGELSLPRGIILTHLGECGLVSEVVEPLRENGAIQQSRWDARSWFISMISRTRYNRLGFRFIIEIAVEIAYIALRYERSEMRGGRADVNEGGRAANVMDGNWLTALKNGLEHSHQQGKQTHMIMRRGHFPAQPLEVE
jgi:hypothetical protein